MTINYNNQYAVGYFAPPSGSTATTTSSYSFSSTFPSTSSTMSSVYPSHSSSSSFPRDMLLSCDLQQAEYNALCSSPVPQSRARCRSPPAQPSVTCPGERGISSAAAAVGAVSFGVHQHQHITTTQPRMESSSQSTLIQKVDTWPESFQDLRSWCHPDQDELNTPQITLQDEFNFSPDGPVNNTGWGFIESPVEMNDQMLNQDLLLASPSNNLIMDEENNNYAIIDIQGNFSMEMGKSSVENVPMMVMMPGSSALKNKSHDVLLSQAIQDESPPVIAGETLLGGGFFDKIKLNSSQTSAARLGSGGKLIFKQEAKDVKELRVPAKEPAMVPLTEVVPQTLVSPQTFQPLQPVRRTLQPKTKPRPKLKPLNIPQPASENTSTLSTPDVLKPLTDVSTSGFNLLQYVCGGAEESRVQPTAGKETTILQDHDYTNQSEEDSVLIKCEPLSPASRDRMVERVGGQERKRTYSLVDQDDDYYDSDIHDAGSIDSESEEWVPGGGKRSVGARAGARRGRKLSSGADSIEGPDRYRALRDRNNEASRRSRQNRKQRDMEIRRLKTDLEKKNSVLRVKADRMENLVKEMRAALLQSIINSRKNSSA